MRFFQSRLLILLVLPFCTCAGEAPVVPLIHTHAHNDYEHKRPLLDALDVGFCSVEADIYLVDGKLLVAHDRSDVKPERTLQALYLDPLRERVKANGGRVYRDGPSVTLLIDVKSQSEATYKVLREVLKEYAPMLTIFREGKIEENAVTAIISGNRARDTMAEEKLRYAACDGRLIDLDGKAAVDLVPLVSSSWGPTFTWRGLGPMPDAEARLLRGLVRKAHEQKRRLRFWGTPDVATVWAELRNADVDLVNTDDLVGLQQFLLKEEGGKK
jgi:hypothetical protein